jgi:DNA polymerase III sliding clamp (beta) subunit (PCNA family)
MSIHTAREYIEEQAIGDNPVVVTIPLQAWHELATATVAAGKDEALPTLQHVLLEVEPGVVRIVATDRFRLAVTQWTPEKVDEPWMMWTVYLSAMQVPAAELIAFTKALPKRGADLVVTVQVGDDGTVTMRCDALTTVHSRTVRAGGASWPKWRTLLPTAADYSAPDPTGSGFNAKYLADLAKLPQARVRGGNAPARLRFFKASGVSEWTGEGVEVGWTYILMPVRFEDDGPRHRVTIKPAA